MLFRSNSNERPVRFRLDGHEYMVEELLDQWYGPSDTYFKVRADDGNLYILRRRDIDARRTLAFGVIPAAATPLKAGVYQISSADRSWKWTDAARGQGFWGTLDENSRPIGIG